MFRCVRRPWAAWITVALLLAPAGSLYAQTPEEKAGARAAAEAGAEAFEAGRYEESIELFQRAESVVHATPHLLFIARAQVKLGRLVEAREAFLSIINDPLPSRANRVLVETRAEAERELDALEPRIPQITVVVQGGSAEGLQVYMDDREVPSGLVGIPRPVNPGQHEFYATAVGSESSRTAITIKEGGQETVMLTLRASSTPRQEPTPTESTPASSSDGLSGRHIAAYSALGVGAVGLGLGTVFFLQASGLSDDADTLFQTCDARTCTEAEQNEIRSLDDDAASKRTLSFVGFGVGAAGIAAGITLLLLDSGEEATTSGPTVRPWVGFDSAGVFGTF